MNRNLLICGLVAMAVSVGCGGSSAQAETPDEAKGTAQEAPTNDEEFWAQEEAEAQAAAGSTDSETDSPEAESEAEDSVETEEVE